MCTTPRVRPIVFALMLLGTGFERTSEGLRVVVDTNVTGIGPTGAQPFWARITLTAAQGRWHVADPEFVAETP